ncbi:MAG: diacylglycerol/lipid kinase family protein, partial [Dehalococcoidia bacterium]
AAVRACLEGERRRIDLGRAGDRHFLLMAGYGLDGHIARRVSLSAKRYLGATAYAAAALRESVRYRGRPVTLTLDEERRQELVLMMVAGNTRNYAGLVEVTPRARADDGLLDVCIFPGSGFRDAVLHLLRVVLGRHAGSSNVIYRQVRRLELDWQQPLPLQLDGDAWPESPTRVEVVPGVLDVMVPAGSGCPLFSG